MTIIQSSQFNNEPLVPDDCMQSALIDNLNPRIGKLIGRIYLLSTGIDHSSMTKREVSTLLMCISKV